MMLSRLPHGARPFSLALDGTSGTLLLADTDGNPLLPALLYSDQRAVTQAEKIASVAPANSGALGATSALAKLLWLLEKVEKTGTLALHQVDWLLGKLGAPWGISDENNALKLGYDPISRTWPKWIDALDIPRCILPEVVEPGTPITTINKQVAMELGLPADMVLVAGTTDSVAGFLATGASDFGEGVTSLGSSLALKVLSQRPVFVPEMGIYSHRLGDRWLAGGASNTGGLVLKAYFSDEQITAYSKQVIPDRPTGLNYYPLLTPGERFPVSDPYLPPRLTPRPADDARFFQAILEGIASIESLGYTRLAEAGADRIIRVRSMGGGAANTNWTRIRERLLGVPVLPARYPQAAYGAALLARTGYTSLSHRSGTGG